MPILGLMIFLNALIYNNKKSSLRRSVEVMYCILRIAKYIKNQEYDKDIFFFIDESVDNIISTLKRCTGVAKDLNHYK